MDGVSLAASLDNPARCPELDAYNETGIWITDIPGLPTSHLRYPDLLELMDGARHREWYVGDQEQYRDIVLDAKDRMIRRGKWKLVSQPLTDGTRTMLFNVDEDPGCTRDCITAYPEIGAQLSQALHAWATAGPNARPGTMSERTSVM